ncbi:MAG: VanZ family protein [Bacteroidales bacterium]|nr:VanZ family protein [Bacteroidales bacterium]
MKIIFSIYLFLIIIQAIAPFGKSVRLDEIFIFNFRADHIIHVFVFIPWMFFGIKMNKNLPLWFLWGILFAAGTECLQYFMPYRSFNISDIIANVIGVALGFAFLARREDLSE